MPKASLNSRAQAFFCYPSRGILAPVESPWKTLRRTCPRMALSSSRRSTLHLLLYGGCIGTLVLGRVSKAQAVPSFLASRPNLRARLGQRAPARPEQALFISDFDFPDWFAGTWRVRSELISVSAPAGYRLFGRTGAFEAAKAQQGYEHALDYEARFLNVQRHVYPDRIYNIQSISESAFGKGAVLRCAQDTRDKETIVATVRPEDADGNIYNVKAKTVFRDQTYDAPPAALALEENDRNKIDLFLARAGNTDVFYTSEMMRQSVMPSTNDLRVNPLVKDVETTSVFLKEQSNDRVHCIQRVASYLPRSDIYYPDARGRPVDVRWYVVEYQKK